MHDFCRKVHGGNTMNFQVVFHGRELCVYNSRSNGIFIINDNQAIIIHYLRVREEQRGK